MAHLKRAPIEDVVALLQRIAALAWPIAMADEPAVVQQLGWTVVPGTEGRYLEADTGWPVNRNTADFSSGRIEQLTSITFRVTDIVTEPDPATGDALDDAFADVVHNSETALGTPASRSRRPPSVTWMTQTGGSITITRSDAAVTVNAYSAKLAAAKRTLGS